jgi:serine phosphatase RsbU (regulator of sigma subunit)
LNFSITGFLPSIAYTFRMSSSAPPRPDLFSRIGTFWNRVSEGRDLDDLWSQFVDDARSSYGFYGKDVDWDEVNRLPAWMRPFRIGRQLFWAMMSKLSPARRVILLIALILLVSSGFKFEFPGHSTLEVDFQLFSALLFLLLLSLELADKITIKRDLEIAREIQAWLVPSTPPPVPNAEVAFYTRPQNSVAGDYYDAFYPTRDAATGGKLLLVMADVAGKSIPAALLMATLQASLHTIASEGLPLTQLATRLNQYACAHSLGGQRFTTAVLAEYDPATQILSYVNAGHNSPVVRRANSSTERLESGGLPLGITPEATFPSADLQLQSGDTLVLFTDGVVEAFNSSGEEYSDARWLSVIRGLPILNAQQTLNFLMNSVSDFVGATRQSDDITCLVLRCS